MRQQNKQTRKAAAKAQPSLLGDWQSFRALQEAVYTAQGKQVPAFDFQS
ncbi:MAG: hypothetical protein ABSG33_10595 [Candidatus Bathyarchaeia archaeon]|jgi:hypothetical protein